MTDVLTLEVLQRAAQQIDRHSAKTWDGYVAYVHPCHERWLQREWARENGSPIRRHTVARGQRARRRARLWSWHPRRLANPAFGFERVVQWSV